MTSPVHRTVAHEASHLYYGLGSGLCLGQAATAFARMATEYVYRALPPVVQVLETAVSLKAGQVPLHQQLMEQDAVRRQQAKTLFDELRTNPAGTPLKAMLRLAETFKTNDGSAAAKVRVGAAATELGFTLFPALQLGARLTLPTVKFLYAPDVGLNPQHFEYSASLAVRPGGPANVNLYMVRHKGEGRTGLLSQPFDIPHLQRAAENGGATSLNLTGEFFNLKLRGYYEKHGTFVQESVGPGGGFLSTFQFPINQERARTAAQHLKHEALLTAAATQSFVFSAAHPFDTDWLTGRLPAP